MHGRGTTHNPSSRFDRLVYEPDEEFAIDGGSLPDTQVFHDTSRTIITHNDSPDVGFDCSINPYRGCEHGCIYCYARPTHEYLGFSAGLDFESRILAKLAAPLLLRQELSAKAWKPQPLAISGVTDPYQPVERRFRLTRGCLEVLVECRNPVVVITKNHLVTRDTDLLAELAHYNAAAVYLSISTLDGSLAGLLEPRASRPLQRLAAIETLTRAGIPTGVMVAPLIPGLTDHQVPAILKAAAQAGATSAGYTLLRLPHGVADLFEAWLKQHFPDRKEKVLNRIRETRGGQLSDPRYGTRMRGEGEYAGQLSQLFSLARKQAGIRGAHWALCTSAFQKPRNAQLELFDPS
jgi:DNA repair photolyase